MLRDPPMERTFRFSEVDLSLQGGFKDMFWEGLFTLIVYICRNHTAMLRMDGADNVMTLTATETTLPPDAHQRRQTFLELEPPDVNSEDDDASETGQQYEHNLYYVDTKSITLHNYQPVFQPKKKCCTCSALAVFLVSIVDLLSRSNCPRSRSIRRYQGSIVASVRQ